MTLLWDVESCPECGRHWTTIEKSLRWQDHGQLFVICVRGHEYKAYEVTNKTRTPMGIVAQGLETTTLRKASL